MEDQNEQNRAVVCRNEELYVSFMLNGALKMYNVCYRDMKNAINSSKEIKPIINTFMSNAFVVTFIDNDSFPREL